LAAVSRLLVNNKYPFSDTTIYPAVYLVNTMTTCLTVERNGRKFIVDWKIEKVNMPSFIVKEFTIGDCCFLLIFSSSTKTFALNLSKKPAAESAALLQLSIFNLEPHEITVSKDDTHLQVMPKTSANEWGRVSWDLTRRLNRNHYEDAWYSDYILPIPPPAKVLFVLFFQSFKIIYRKKSLIH